MVDVMSNPENNNNNKSDSIPDDVRVYAIGDIHGYLDPLNDMHDKIEKHLAGNPIARPIIVYLGDYIDRGPESSAVIGALSLVKADNAGIERVFIKGNHEWGMLGFMEEPLAFGQAYLKWGGLDTVKSYGVKIPDVMTQSNVTKGIVLPAEYERLSQALKEAVENAGHIEFLDNLEYYHLIGGYMFVHAGIKPDVAINDQDDETMMRIREPFLTSDAQHPYRVVHGHSIFEDVEIKPNRISVDTGFYEQGLLSCVVLEKDAVDVLQVKQELDQTTLWQHPE
jgi:serine/threonine protein phosphatase 1